MMENEQADSPYIDRDFITDNLWIGKVEVSLSYKVPCLSVALTILSDSVHGLSVCVPGLSC